MIVVETEYQLGASKSQQVNDSPTETTETFPPAQTPADLSGLGALTNATRKKYGGDE